MSAPRVIGARVKSLKVEATLIIKHREGLDLAGGVRSDGLVRTPVILRHEDGVTRLKEARDGVQDRARAAGSRCSDRELVVRAPPEGVVDHRLLKGGLAGDRRVSGSPARIDTWPAAMLTSILGTKCGETRRAPRSASRMAARPDS